MKEPWEKQHENESVFFLFSGLFLIILGIIFGIKLIIMVVMHKPHQASYLIATGICIFLSCGFFFMSNLGSRDSSGSSKKELHPGSPQRKQELPEADSEEKLPRDRIPLDEMSKKIKNS